MQTMIIKIISFKDNCCLIMKFIKSTKNDKIIETLNLLRRVQS